MFKKIASTFVVKVLTSAINLLIVVILSRYLGASGKGDASLIVTGITMVLLFCNMVGGASLIYLVPRSNIFLTATLSNLWSLVVCALSFFILRHTNILPQQFIFHICVLTFINSLLVTNLSILLGKEKIFSSNAVSLLQSIINLIVLYIIIKFSIDPKISAYINSLYAAMISCFIISSALVIPFVKKISFQNAKKISGELFRLGFMNQAGHIMKFASVRISYFLLNYLQNKSGLGVFSNGVSLAEAVLLISNSIATVQYSTIVNTSDNVQSQQLTLRLCRISTVVCLAVIFPMVLLPSSFYVWLFGEEFSGVKNIIVLLAPGILFYNMALITGHYFSGVGKYKVNSIGNLIGLIVTVIMSLIFFADYTIANAAIICTVAYFFNTVYVLIFFLKESNLQWKNFLPAGEDFKWMKNQLLSFLK